MSKTRPPRKKVEVKEGLDFGDISKNELVSAMTEKELNKNLERAAELHGQIKMLTDEYNSIVNGVLKPEIIARSYEPLVYNSKRLKRQVKAAYNMQQTKEVLKDKLRELLNDDNLFFAMCTVTQTAVKAKCGTQTLNKVLVPGSPKYIFKMS